MKHLPIGIIDSVPSGEPIHSKKSLQKMDVYHRFVQTGLIAQGLLQYLSTVKRRCLR